VPDPGVIFDGSGRNILGITTGFSGPTQRGTVFEMKVGKN